MQSEMKEQIGQHIKRVKERHELCRGNEQATKYSLIAPLFAILGYDITDPRECIPEYRMNFGKGEKAATPVDWAFLINDHFAFFVEAKETGDKLAGSREQLGVYFGKQPGPDGVKLGILTNGTQWQFFTDLRNDNAMDTEPFLTWDLLKHDLAFPMDLLTILQKSTFKPQLIRAFAERKKRQSLLVGVLNRLLEPSPEFVKFAIGTRANDAGDTIVSAKITDKVIGEWTPILKDAIHEWAKHQTLTIVLQHSSPEAELGTTQNGDKPAEKAEQRHQADASLADLIAAGILAPPLKMFRKYKGKGLDATLLADGAVEFQGQRYATCSGAAEAARATVSGRRLNTNGWTFWQYQGAGGKRLTLADARRQVGPTPRRDTAVSSRREHPPERYSLRRKFWEGLLGRPKVKDTRHANIAAGEYSWMGAGSGVRGLPFIYTVGQDEGRVELWIDRGTGKAAENKEIFDRIHKHKEEIEKTIGGELSWQRLDAKQGCRIACMVPAGGYRSDESKWPEIQDAMIDAMVRLEKALVPQLAKLKTE